MDAIQGVHMAEIDRVGNGVLWNTEVSPKKYGEQKQYYDHIFEQYKLYVETAEATSGRRGLANTFFLTLHTLIITTIGLFFQNGFQIQNKWMIFLPLLACVTLCWAWWRIIKSFKQLNTAKFKVIGEFEKHLPAMPFVSAEWNMLGKGQDPNLYRELTDVENLVPLIFAGLYILGGIVVAYL
jgi:hypothetical protein